ncbi:MAG: hypothetical protein RIE08_16320 [Acidimicrobiales bacterium]
MRRDADDAGVDAAATSRVREILSQLEESDFERLDPPPELWERIDAAVRADAARARREPPSRDSSASEVVEYWIDANDVVVDVGHSWAESTRDNDAPELAIPASDRTLWTYFDNSEVRELWRLLVERVRRFEKRAEVPLRCDAPDARRWFDMTVTPESDGRVHFRCALTFEEARPPVSLLDLKSERDDGLEPVPLCGWCGRAQHDSRWLDIEEAVQAGRLLERASMPPLSHGICASCRDEMSAELLVPGGVAESTT